MQKKCERAGLRNYIRKNASVRWAVTKLSPKKIAGLRNYGEKKCERVMGTYEIIPGKNKCERVMGSYEIISGKKMRA